MVQAEPVAGGIEAASLEDIEPRLAKLGRLELRATLAPHIERLHGRLQPNESPALIDGALAVCRALYSRGRSGEGLPLARSALAQAARLDDHSRMRKAATAAGVLSADSLDLVGAIEHHV